MRRELVEELFRSRPGETPRTAIGAELEMIPVRVADGTRAPIHDDAHGSGTATVIREVARRARWIELDPGGGAPAWRIPGGGTLSYEPGGQIEIATPVAASHAALVRFLAGTVGSLRERAAAHGIELLLCGVDPYNAVESVPLALRSERYRRMDAYFRRIGQSGERMMRQTASLQVSVELGPHPMERWRLLNALAPYLLAVSASSRRYAGTDTGVASYRARLWRTLDASRTGLPYDAGDPVGGYTAFAAGAGRILDGDAAHLTTLFPEVRPRGYFEIRSMDAMELPLASRVIEWIHRIVYDPLVTREAIAIAGDPDVTLLVRAGDLGLADPVIARGVAALERIAGIVVTKSLHE